MPRHESIYSDFDENETYYDGGRTYTGNGLGEFPYRSRKDSSSRHGSSRRSGGLGTLLESSYDPSSSRKDKASSYSRRDRSPERSYRKRSSSRSGYHRSRRDSSSDRHGSSRYRIESPDAYRSSYKADRHSSKKHDSDRYSSDRYTSSRDTTSRRESKYTLGGLGMPSSYRRSERSPSRERYSRRDSGDDRYRSRRDRSSSRTRTYRY